MVLLYWNMKDAVEEHGTTSREENDGEFGGAWDDEDPIRGQGAQVTSGQEGDHVGGRAWDYFTGASDWT